MKRHKHRTYDDNRLAMDIAAGVKSFEEIGGAHGLSGGFVAEVARGKVRVDLQRKIVAAKQGFLEQAQRLGGRLVLLAMQRLGILIGPETPASPAVQRQAAMDILSLPMGDPCAEPINPFGATVDVHCRDGVLTISKDLFDEADDRTDWKGDPLPWRCVHPRREYLRILAHRTDPGGPRVLTSADDMDTLRVIYREQGITMPHDPPIHPVAKPPAPPAAPPPAETGEPA